MLLGGGGGGIKEGHKNKSQVEGKEAVSVNFIQIQLICEKFFFKLNIAHNVTYHTKMSKYSNHSLRRRTHRSPAGCPLPWRTEADL